MVDYHAQFVEALSRVLPTHYEMRVTAKTPTPCISYMEVGNYVDANGNTIGYSRIQFQVKVWANSIELIQKYACEVDDEVRPLGFIRISSNEMYDNKTSLIAKILTYEALALENY